VIVNLFSLFDPSMSVFSFNWFSLYLVFLLSFLVFYSSGAVELFLKVSISLIYKEADQILKGKSGVGLFIIPVFFFVLYSNLISMAPSVFPVSSHLCVVFPIGFLFWVSPLLFGWSKLPNIMMKSLVPQGTPYVLIPFIVLIEIISSLIRPVTLSVRLTANITAGHLLISILVSFLSEFDFVLLSLVPLVIMNLLELGVAVIQSYVFITLLSIYTSEVYIVFEI
jgi:ATP synthase subunit 6